MKSCFRLAAIRQRDESSKGDNGLSGTPLKTTIQSFTVEKSITVTLDGAALSR